MTVGECQGEGSVRVRGAAKLCCLLLAFGEVEFGAGGRGRDEEGKRETLEDSGAVRQ